MIDLVTGRCPWCDRAPDSFESLSAFWKHLPACKSKKRHKYGAQRTVANGIWFASKREATRYGMLRLAEQHGLIRDLRLQVRYKLVVRGTLVCTYVADSVYHEDGKLVVEDCKGVRTRVYRVKAKLFFALTGIRIRET